MKMYPVFEFLPFETIIKDRQEMYYQVLSESDKAGASTAFIEFMLEAIHDSLAGLFSIQHASLTAASRIDYYISMMQVDSFTRKDYLHMFKDISQATASRDLTMGVQEGVLERFGDKRTSYYRVVEIS